MKTVNLIGPATFPIALRRMDPQDDMALHSHDNIELVVIIGGSGRHRTRDGRYALARGDVFVVPVGMPHGYERVDGLRLVNLVFDPVRAELPLGRLASLPGYHALVSLEPGLRRHHDFSGHLRLDEPALAWLERALDDLEAELASRTPAWDQASCAWLLQILIRLARLYADHDAPASRLVVRLGAVLAHLETHLDQDLDLDRLGRIGGMSKSTLQRCFRALYGVPVKRHVTDLRLRVARDLLASGLPVAEVGRRVGIHDANYFSRVFRRGVGTTAGSFRARARSTSTSIQTAK